MIPRARLTPAALVAAAIAVTSIRTYAQHVTDASRQHVEARHYDGPPVTLTNLLQEALEKNPALIALRQQIQVARQRPNRERARCGAR